MSNRRVLLLIVAVLAAGALGWVIQSRQPDRQETRNGAGETGGSAAQGDKGEANAGAAKRSERRSETGDDEAVNALLTDSSLQDKEAGVRLLDLAIRLEKENQNGVEALVHATHLLDDADYPKLLKWFETSPPDRRLAEAALMDSSARSRVDQCKLRLSLLKSEDQSVRAEAIDELRFLLELPDTAPESEARLALGALIAEEANSHQGDSK